MADYNAGRGPFYNFDKWHSVTDFLCPPVEANYAVGLPRIPGQCPIEEEIQLWDNLSELSDTDYLRDVEVERAHRRAERRRLNEIERQRCKELTRKTGKLWLHLTDSEDETVSTNNSDRTDAPTLNAEVVDLTGE